MEKNIKQVTNVSYEYLKGLEKSIDEFRKNSKWYYYHNLSFYCTEEDKIVEKLISDVKDWKEKAEAKNLEIFALKMKLEEYKNRTLWRRILNR